MTNGLKYVLDSLRRASDNSDCWPVYPAESGLILAEFARLNSELDAVRAALGNGADEAAWPPGLTLSEAVARLREERPAVVAYLRSEPTDDISIEEYADDIERGDHRREDET